MKQKLNMIKEIYENAFNVILPKRYRKMLEQYKMWTSNGINEVNLTVNLTAALIEALNDNDAFTCYEVPMSIEKKVNGKVSISNQRIDGMVFSPKHNAIFYIESKKYKRNQSKYIKSHEEDFNILLNLDKNQITDRLRFSKEGLTEYIILIADHWKLGDSLAKGDKFLKTLKPKVGQTEFIDNYSFESIKTEGENPETYMILSTLLLIK